MPCLSPGAVNIPGAMIGIVVGGAILKRFQMSLRQCSALCVLGMLLCLLTAFPLLFLGCPTQKVAGVTYWDRYHCSAGLGIPRVGTLLRVRESQAGSPQMGLFPQHKQLMEIKLEILGDKHWMYSQPPWPVPHMVESSQIISLG